MISANKLLLSLTLSLAACGQGTHALSLANSNSDSNIIDAASVAMPAPSMTCAINMHVRFSNWQKRQKAWYTQHGVALPIEANQSQMTVGWNGRSIVLVHGFLSSPAYLKDMADVFVQQGFTVVIPLLTGYGSTAAAANASTVHDWRESINMAFSLARQCSSSTSLIAHSLGGALTTQDIEDGKLGQLDRVVMLAPYYQTYSLWTQRLTDYFPLPIEELDVARIQSWVKPLGIQLPNFQTTPGLDLTLPLKAVRKVVDLQDSLKSYAGRDDSIEIFPIVSMDDETIDSAYALDYLKKHFQTAEPIIYPAGSKVWHSLETPADNPQFASMVAKISDYLNESHH